MLVAEALTRFQVQIDPHLEREAEIPMLGAPQRQGDVLFIDSKVTVTEATEGAKQVGTIAIVQGENGGNTHRLWTTAPVWVRVVTRSNNDVLDFTIPAGVEAYIEHPEHGFLGLEPGNYTARRQREQAEIIRQVAD